MIIAARIARTWLVDRMWEELTPDVWEMQGLGTSAVLATHRVTGRCFTLPVLWMEHATYIESSQPATSSMRGPVELAMSKEADEAASGVESAPRRRTRKAVPPTDV